MKNFKFKLESVLRLRQRELQASADEYQFELQARTKIESEVEVLEQSTCPNRARSQVIGVGQVIVPHQILEADRYRQELQKQLIAKRKELNEQQSLIAAKHETLLAARKNLQVLIELRERQLEAWKQQSTRDQQSQTDEIARLRYSAVQRRKRA